jgi:hypothetical protein
MPTTPLTSSVRRAAAALVAVVATTHLSACGEEEVPVDDSLKSTAGQAFSLEPGEEGMQSVVGHGVVLEVPAAWEGYDEQDSFDGTTYEWAVSEPDRAPAPAYVQFSMGKKGKGSGFEQIDEATKALGTTDSSFELLDEGDADVPGAERAKFLRFELTKDNNGTPVDLEQLQLFLEMPGGQVSTVRFIAPQGEWDELMEPVYDSLVVAEGDSA